MSLPARASIARRTLFAFAAALAAASCATASPSDDFFRAVISDNPGAVERLLKQGFDPNGRDPKGQTGLLLALREPSPRVAKVLIASPRVNVDATNASDETPLMMAALKGQQEYVDLLLARDAAVNKPGWAPLHYAATNGHISIMKQLLEQHAFIDAQSPNGTTPLMMAAMYGSAEAVKLLLDEGADIAMKNQLGMTALDFAKRGNRPDAVEMLTRAQQLKRRPAGAGKW
ncbi:MAG: ankyrin repeat domain-containing protein [Gammaproteobacteria bacterium]